MKKNIRQLVCLFLSICVICSVSPFSAASDTLIHLTSFDDVSVADENNDSMLFTDGLLAVCVSDKWGYVNANGEIVIDFQYDSAQFFLDGVACVEKNNKKFIIDTNGEVLSDLSAYDSMSNLGDKMILVCTDGLYGVVSHKGTVRVEPQWDFVSAAENNLHVVSKNGKYGYVSTSGNIILDPVYTYANPFSEDAAYVETADGAHQLIDRKGNVLLEDAYSSVVDGVVVVHRDGAWGLSDPNGEIHVECVWDDVQAPSEGLVAVCKDDLWGFSDYSGTVVIEPQWNFVWDFSDDMAITAQMSSETGSTDLYGCINKIGLEICPPQYTKLLSFSDGLAAFLDPDTQLWGYIDKEGTVVIKPSYDEAYSFSEGYALVRKGSKYSVIDAKGFLLTVSNVDNGAWLSPGDEELHQPAVEKLPEKKTVDIGQLISLIISLVFISFFVFSLLFRIAYRIKKKKQKRMRAVSKSDEYAQPYEEENFFASVKVYESQNSSASEDYDDYDIHAYYDDLDGDDLEELELPDQNSEEQTVEKDPEIQETEK